MTQEDKNILLKDLSARLPYCGLICQTNTGKGTLISVECSFGEALVYVDFGYPQAEEFDLNEDDEVKPYLRPMSSITQEELKELNDKYGNIAYFFMQDPPYYYGLQAQHSDIGSIEISEFSKIYDWLDAHYFDYRIVPSTGNRLIESCLALEAIKGMYKTD